MNVKNWSFFYSREGKSKAKEYILDTISLWGAIGLLWTAFVSIIQEYFPDFLYLTVLVSKSERISTSYVGAGNFERIDMDWWVIGLFVFLLWLGYEWPQKYLKKLVLPCRIFGIAIPVIYVFVNFEKIIDGILQILQIYLPFINDYYKTRFFMEPSNSGKYSIVAFTAICMLLWWIVWMLAYGFKKRVILAVFPILALVLELLVGLSPKGNGLLYIFFAVVILAIMGGTSVAKKGFVLACVGLTVLLSRFLFEDDIQKLATKEQKQAVLDWQESLSLGNFNLASLLQLDLHFNLEPLNNNSPQYTGKVILELEGDKIPVSTVYLRGFYGTNYEDGNWIYDDSYFKNACVKAVKSEEEVAQKLFQMPYDRKIAYYDLTTNLAQYTINYVGSTGDVAYTMYGADFGTLDEAYTLMGDYLLKKSIWDDSVTMSIINGGFTPTNWRIVNVYLEEEVGKSADIEWMNGLADAYLGVPENAQYISLARAEAEKWITKTDYEYIGIELSETESENDRRINYATAISKYLSLQMSYSLKLDPLPGNEDPIEYALMESHEGYCMHFASAATLMLREAGIPARYVSGYAVNPSKFMYDKEREVYIAEVSDYMAHAWVEIYLEAIGWVPVEVTPGGSLEEVPSDEQMQQWEETANDRREQLNSENQTETEDSEERLPDDEIDTEGQTESASESETEDSTKDTGRGAGDKKFGELLLEGLKVLGILGVFAGIIVGIYVGVKHWISGYEAVLTKEVEKNLTRKAVKRINRRLYFTLRISKGRNWFVKKWSDAEYKHALAEAFTSVTEEEWNHYMEIVKKNHYSREVISVAEMQYCYDCYKKANLFNKKLTMPWHK